MARPAPAPSAAPEDPHVEAVESLGAGLAAAGFPHLPARVFAALLTTEEGRLTSAELVALLHVSPAAVSGAVRYLGQVRMIRRERERGSRRDVYVVMDDAWHDVLMQRDQLYAPILTALVEALEVVGASSRAGQRVQLSVEFLEFVQREMGQLAQRWEQYKADRRLG
ncbi:GbsR/MarR family transcriptional regulator [Phycicoccus duodecadis]|uniref:DNA-binding transcriptional regulator GbsR (MarR family) n=1 Tax=Phycicoccus duodecadis TaxID=173053 RepID=A0A2N3YKC0_9MICO|nr:MarR family transcriptional regulator [Phycicoccus duodecadis]PKW27300.1 DNA-binding transcriptional regulator GbsR (MarR family) [Phycicoccus duodecadis]